MFIFGGFSGAKENLKIFTFDFKTEKWSNFYDYEGKNGPKGRDSRSVEIIGDELFIFSGKSEGIICEDFWSFNLKTKTFGQILPKDKKFFPIARGGHSCSVYKDKIILFGGSTGITH